MSTMTTPQTADCRAQPASVEAGPVGVPGRVGPVDHLLINDVLGLFPTLPVWSEGGRHARRERLAGARRILEWLRTHPGDGWQQRC